MASDDIAALVKFCNIETGLKVLNSQSLRWSSPHLYCDPFEPDHLSDPDFTPEGLASGMIKEAINMLFGPTEPTGKSNRLVAAICRWRDEERFNSEEEAADVLKQLLAQVATAQQQSVDGYMAAWKKFASNQRICSFSDKPTNLFCWQRYGDNHQGVALKFACGEDTALPETRRLSYTTTPSLVTSLKEQVAVTYGKDTPPDPAEFLDKLLSKNKDNSAEREWRCFSTDTDDANSDESLWYSNKKFSAPELKSIYLGLKTGRKDREEIIKLIKEKYKNTTLFQAEAVKGKYELNFVQVGTK